MSATSILMPGQHVQRLLRSRLMASLSFPHDVDDYLQAFNPSWSVSGIKATVRAVSHPTADSVTLKLRPNRNWQGFNAGQFVQLGVEIDGVRRSRCYSLAGSAHAGPGQIELTIKAHGRGCVSSFLHHQAAPGMVVSLSPAQGEFVLPHERPNRVLLISGGSGITPVMAMLRTLLDEAYQGRISFLHYARSPADMIYRAELEQIARQHPQIDLLRVYSQAADGEAQGALCAAQLQALVPDYAMAETFLCGPASLMQAVESLWRHEGLQSRLHLERFAPLRSPAAKAGEGRGELCFARSGCAVGNDGRSLLEQAEAAGLRPSSGCRMGICSTCSCRKAAGSVRNLLSGEVSSETDVDIRLCVSVALGDVTLDL